MWLNQESIIALGDTQADRYWQHVRNTQPAFNHHFFSDEWLQDAKSIVGVASAGRGNTHFIELDGELLVLRHYKRGGYVSKVSEDRYLWTGLQSARPFHELSVLVHLNALDLPAPKPYAAEVIRSGASYSGSLITYRVPGLTLAQAFLQDKMTPDLWHQVGLTIRSFHSHGVCHADLNAHNILVHWDETIVGQSSVALLDFDRATLKDAKQADWQHKVLTRLQRSLLKVADKHNSALLEIAWQTVLDGAHGKSRV